MNKMKFSKKLKGFYRTLLLQIDIHVCVCVVL